MLFSNPKNKERLKLILVLITIWTAGTLVCFALAGLGNLLGLHPNASYEENRHPHDDYSPYYGWQ